MTIPKDVSGQDLIKALKKLDYKVTRQTGSHVRLTSILNGEHHITIPNHNPIKVGTLNSIINDIADHKKIDKATLVNKLFK